ncbi:hypothetical protein ACKQTC_07235 [Peptococcus simiae]|uniref:HTH cro/C1-type domain-containing protein n=1 Tax=Peptococcus simiae TaxID=1643805 RepID=A0ABW9H030_9FIRM
MELLKAWHNLPEEDKYKASIPIAKILRNDASGRVKDLIEAQGKTASYISEQIGVTRGGLSRNLKGNFNCPLDSLRILAYQEFNVSIHYIFFGEKGTSQLPRLLEEVMAAEDLPKLEGRLEDPTVAPPLLYRLTELAQDRGLPLPNLGGLKASQDLKMTFRKLEKNPDFTPRINFFIFLAMYLDTSMDYLLGNNYARFTDISVHGKTIRDKDRLGFLRCYLELDKEEQVKVAGRVLAGDWQEKGKR